ncbi:MAG: thioredoxin [Patescibacteria group bacterium]
MIRLLNKKNFKKEVLEESKIPVLVDFYADWCPPCRVLSPILEELEGKYQDKIKFAKVNVGEEQDLASNYKVISIPTLIIFKNGQEIKRMVGLLPKEDLEKILELL